MKKFLKSTWVFMWGFIWCFFASGVDYLTDEGKYVSLLLGLSIPIIMLALGNKWWNLSEIIPE